MGIFEKLKISDTTVAKIEWDITPDLAFCVFSAKGMRGEMVNTNERVCYFFIDNWGTTPKIYFMERGVRYINILAEVKAPLAIITDCMGRQGGTSPVKGNYPIDSPLKEWLLAEVVEPENSPFLLPTVDENEQEEDFGELLSHLVGSSFKGEKVALPTDPTHLDDDELCRLISQWNFFDAKLNGQGKFENALADTGDGLSVIDERTGLMWQRMGLDIGSIRTMNRNIEKCNEEGFAGFHDWRMPTIEEAMSLMESSSNAKGVYLHPCFSIKQPFIFVSARRKPTGYWFVDYTRGLTYWSSGTVPGGFGRLCRQVS